MIPSTKPLLVFSESEDLALQLLARARRFCDANRWTLAAVAVAAEADACARGGADIVVRSRPEISAVADPDLAAELLSSAIRELRPGMVLVGATRFGMEVAPRVAERLEMGYGPWVRDFWLDGESDEVCASCNTFGGIARMDYQFRSTPILTVAEGTFEAHRVAEHRMSTLQVSIPAVSSRVLVDDEQLREVGGTQLRDAKVVIDIGLGVKDLGGLEMIQDLADLLDGQVGCTRPVSSDRDWFPAWLGLSGLKIQPDLCFAIGSSGAIQHIVGIRDSRLIVAVNSDPHAGIFQHSDYGVVADLHEFVPVLMERLRKRGVTVP